MSNEHAISNKDQENRDTPAVQVDSPKSPDRPSAGKSKSHEEDQADCDYDDACSSVYGSHLGMSNELGFSSLTLNGHPVQDVAELLPVAPDGGYGWIIVIAAFISNLMVDGICNAFTEFKSEYAKHFEASDAQTALIGSLLIGFYLLVGPIVGGLVNKIGSRKVVIIGAAIGAAGLGLSIFSPNIYVFMFLYGIVGGIGFGFIYLPAIVVVGFYFEKKRAVATGIAVAGSGVGTIVMPVLSAYCISTFGWKTAVLVLAVCIGSCALFGLLYKPLPYAVPDQKDVELQPLRSDEDRAASKLSNLESPKKEVLNGEDPSMIRLRNALSECENEEADEKKTSKNRATSTTKDAVAMRPRKATLTSITSDMASSRGNLATQHNRMSARSFAQSLSKLSTGGKSTLSIALSGVDANEFTRPLNRQDVFYGGSITNLKEYKEEGNMKNYRSSVLSIPRSTIAEAAKAHGVGDHGDLNDVNHRIGGSRMSKLAEDEVDLVDYVDDSKCKCIPRPIRDAVGEMIDLSLLKDPAMILICASNLLGMMGFYIPLVFLKDLASTFGIPSERSVYLVPVIGITNTAGRVVFGWIADRGFVTALAINNFSLISCGIMTMLCPFLTTYELQMAYSAVFGFIISAYISLTSIVLTDILGLDKLTNSFGLLVVARGIASLSGSPFAGMVYDITKSYQAAFYFSGFVMTIAGLITCAVPFAVRRQKAKEQYEKDVDAISGKLSVLTERSEENLTEYQRTIQSLRQQHVLLQEMEEEKKKQQRQHKTNGVVEELNEEDEKESNKQ